MKDERETIPVCSGSSSAMMWRMSKGVASRPTSAKNAWMASGVRKPLFPLSTCAVLTSYIGIRLNAVQHALRVR